MTLVQLIDTDMNANHGVSIIVCWIFDSNYKRALPLIKESQDIICSTSKDKTEMYAEFKDIYYAVKCVNLKAKSEKTE